MLSFPLLIGIIAANVFVFCLWRLPGMRRVMFTYFTSNPSSSKWAIILVAFLHRDVIEPLVTLQTLSADTQVARGLLRAPSPTSNLSRAQTHYSIWAGNGSRGRMLGVTDLIFKTNTTGTFLNIATSNLWPAILPFPACSRMQLLPE